MIKANIYFWFHSSGQQFFLLFLQSKVWMCFSLFFSSSLCLRLLAELKWTDAQADHILADLSHLENKVRLKIKRLAGYKMETKE